MTPRRKILVYTLALEPGGAERVVALLAGGLARRGHEVVLATDWDAHDQDALLPSSIRRPQMGRNHARSVLTLARLLRAERPDVAISALAISNLKLWLAASLVGRAGRVVQTAHGFAEAEPGLLSGAWYRTLPLSSRMTAATVAVSRALRDDLVARHGAGPARTRCIHNPAETGPPRTAPDEAELRGRPPLVLAVGRLEPVKRYDLLLRAFARLENPAAHLAIVGEGSQRGALMALAADLGIAHRLALPGHVGAPWDWYDRASCLVVSSATESFGLTLVEAMARGLPVVSTACGGPREVLAEGRYGTLVPFDDPAALADAIARALASAGDPAPRIAHARRFATEPVLDAYEALIDAVASGALQPLSHGSGSVL